MPPPHSKPSDLLQFEGFPRVARALNVSYFPRKLVVVRDWKDTLTTVKSLRRLRGGAKKGKMAPEVFDTSTIAKSMKWALDISWCGVFDFSRAVKEINF